MSKPFILIKLDIERKLRLSNKAFIIYEEITGKKVSQIDFDCIGISDINYLIYAGLKSQDESITYNQVVDLIDEHGNVEELGEALNEATKNSSFLSPKGSKKKKV